MNPYHDRRGRFTTASGTQSGGKPPEYGRGRIKRMSRNLPYTVVWFEGSHSNKQEKQFATFEEAKAWAKEHINPMKNGQVMPNLPDHLFDGDVFDGRPYESGVFDGPNKYAAIVESDKK